MTRYAYDGNTRAWWITSISDISSVTASEIGAGTDITPFLPKDGLNPNASQNMVDNGTIASTHEDEVVGTWKISYELIGFRDSVEADDDFWTLAVYGTVGFLVIRRGVPVGTAVAAGQRIEVHPAQLHQPVPRASAINENTKFTLKIATTSEPDLKAVVSAS